MNLIQTKFEIEYPQSDGEPMGESDWHIDWTFRLRQLLKWRYRNQPVYVGSDLIVYYREGDPRKSVVPDGFVVLNHPPHKRRIYKIWEEGNRPPDVAFEFTSLSSKNKDTNQKPKTYAAIGVKEYFIYDPEREYLKPPLQGFRLVGGQYVKIEPDANQAFHCLTLDLGFRIVGDELVVSDLSTGERLLTGEEAEEQRAEAEEQRAEAEEQRADAQTRRAEAQTRRAEAQNRRAEAEAAARREADAEVQRLRAELKRLRDDS